MLALGGLGAAAAPASFRFPEGETWEPLITSYFTDGRPNREHVINDGGCSFNVPGEAQRVLQP